MSERHEMPGFDFGASENDPMRPSSRRLGLPALAAVTLIVALLIGVFHAVAPGWGGIFASATPPLTFAALPGPRGQWVTVNGMSNGTPAIVTSDPLVVYEVFNDTMESSGPPVLKRSSDGGATWQVLPIPGGQVQASGMGTLVTAIPSPTNPNLVFLTVGVPYPRSCPTWPPGAHYQTYATGSGHASMLSAGIPASGYIQCSYEYLSTDGGHTWRQITLPFGGQLFPAPFGRLGSGNLDLYTQGDRFYSVDQGDHGEQHLVRSDDGGATWRVIDLPQAALAATGQTFYDYRPAPTGSMVFATTSDVNATNYTLWRSDNAGASWRPVIGSFPDNGYTSMQVIDRSGNTVPLLYIALSGQDGTSPTGSATQFMVSTDGGVTWTAAPTNGLLPPSQMEPMLQGTLADGSILVEGPRPSPSGPSALVFYAWKDGQSAWRQVAPGVVSGRLLAITAPDANGHQALWVIQGYGDGTVQRCVL